MMSDVDSKYDFNSDSEGSVLVDSNQSFINEIRKYPLLTLEEEKKYGKDLKLINGLEIVDQNNKLDFFKVLSSITEDNVDEVIDSLKKLNQLVDSSTLDWSIFNDYLKKYREKGEILNQEELSQLGIKKKEIIPSSELLEQIKKYVLYSVAKRKMFYSNMRLSISPATKYHASSGIDFFDLFSEGSIGLMQAIDRYDVDLGYRFSTYAMWWIKRYMISYIRGNSSVLTTPVNYWEDVKKFLDAVDDLKKKTKRDYTVSELASIFKLDYRIVLDYLTYNKTVVSLNATVGDDEDTTLIELVPDESVHDFHEKLFHEDLHSMLENCISHLSDKDQLVFRMLYGMNDDHTVYTVNEVSKKLKISRERVLSIQKKGLILIRRFVNQDKKAKELKLFI